MVVEYILTPQKAEAKPWVMFFVGIIYSSIALGVSLFLFRAYASLVMVFFTVFASIPLIYYTIKYEEKKDLQIDDEVMLLKEHSRALTFFTFLFLGFVISFTFWYSVLPAEFSADAFRVQSETIGAINNPVTGNAYNFAGALFTILLNNLKVLLFCLLFAFFYGFGAIFILTWNASVIGVAIGNFIQSHTGNLATIIPIALMRYFIHGIPEMLAYFMAGLAGGIISVAVIRHDFKGKKFRNIVVDSADLAFGAVALLVVAALLEVFVSPLVG